MNAICQPQAAQATLLLGPGPSNVPQAVLETLSQPMIGHLDARFIAIMERCKARLRSVMRTDNPVTFPVSGTGSAGMEAVLVNSLEPGDRVVVGVNGVFGTRLANLVERMGATAIRVTAPWGRAVPLEDLAAAARSAKPRHIAVVHGETSTGVAQPMQGLGELAREVDALLLVDCVTSLAGIPVELDAWGVDLAYSGTQKCLNCPPGLSPVTFSPRALKRFAARTRPVPSFYFDLGEILKYLGDGKAGRTYHHTAPVGMVAALDAALGLVLDEGLERRWQRHAEAQALLLERLAGLGLEAFVPAAERLAPLTTVRVPAGVDEARVRRRLLEEDGIELGAGLGPMAGTVWRVGLMGVNATPAAIERLVTALARVLA
jgi:alanine-glyoxylate transaminase/serine-glyoxylate transaminase/serine-pyruvate transaminase